MNHAEYQEHVNLLRAADGSNRQMLTAYLQYKEDCNILNRTTGDFGDS